MNPSDRSPGSSEAWLRFSLAGLSGARQRALLAHFGDVSSLLAAGRRELTAVAGAEAAEALGRADLSASVDRAMHWLAQPGHHFLSIGDPGYPSLLREIADPPLVLYASGRVELLDRDCFAIVGSRNASMQGVRDAQHFARALSDEGYTIASGLALGIDAAAHQGGLSGGSSSIAVLGTGVDRIYPRANHALFDRLQREGTIVSDWPLGTPPLPGNFPRRNRLISGLSRGVLVVEAAPESGSLITARLANEQGREVFAIPGSIHSPLSRGCHELIQDGAKLVTSLEDVLVELTGVRVPRPTAIEAATAPSHPLLDLMGYSPVTIDQMAQRTGDSVSRLAAELFRLEVEGRVAALAGGFFQRLGMQPH